MMDTYNNVTMEDFKKYEVLEKLIRKEIKGYQAASSLGYSEVHISRLKVLRDGFSGILSKKKGSPRKIKDELKEYIKGLYEEISNKVNMFLNLRHFKDHLEEKHHLKLSYETLRKILIEYKLHQPKKKKKVYRRRRRMPKAGMLIQMDSSQHQWIPSIPVKWWLLAAVDDATGEILFAKFYPSDGVFSNMEAIRSIIETKGIFYALYVDKASHFKTTRYGGLHVDVAIEQEDTHIQRALKELSITLIPANSPQAKGRIERSFRTLQDRLIKEMALNGIKDYSEANRFLKEEFIPYYNKKFAKTEGIESVFKPLLSGCNLDLVFCKRFERKVNNDNTIKFEGSIIQLPPSSYKISLAKCVVEICVLGNGKIYILYKGKVIHKTYLAKKGRVNGLYKEIEEFLSQREYEEIAA